MMMRNRRGKERPAVKRALCIGINDYPGVNADLSGCVNDAEDWATALAARGFQVNTLLDAAATKAAIMSALGEMIAATKYGGTALLQFSGHGTWIPDLDNDESDKRDEALCPHDIAAVQLITDDELATTFEALAYGARGVLITDCCHSGPTHKLFEPLGVSRDKVRFLPPEAFLRDDAVLERAERCAPTLKSRSKATVRTSGRILMLAGCADHEFAFDAWFGDRANGAFSHVALGALEALGRPTYQEWLMLMRYTLPSKDYPQTPQLSGRQYMRRWRALA
jgi:hypothetical protein